AGRVRVDGGADVAAGTADRDRADSGDSAQSAERVLQLACGGPQTEARDAGARPSQAIDVDTEDGALAQRELALAQSERGEQFLELALVPDERDAVAIRAATRQCAEQRASRGARRELVE